MQGISDIEDVDLVVSIGGAELYRWVVRISRHPQGSPR